MVAPRRACCRPGAGVSLAVGVPLARPFGVGRAASPPLVVVRRWRGVPAPCGGAAAPLVGGGLSAGVRRRLRRGCGFSRRALARSPRVPRPCSADGLARALLGDVDKARVCYASAKRTQAARNERTSRHSARLPREAQASGTLGWLLIFDLRAPPLSTPRKRKKSPDGGILPIRARFEQNGYIILFNSNYIKKRTN